MLLIFSPLPCFCPLYRSSPNLNEVSVGNCFPLVKCVNFCTSLCFELLMNFINSKWIWIWFKVQNSDTNNTINNNYHNQWVAMNSTVMTFMMLWIETSQLLHREPLPNKYASRNAMVMNSKEMFPQPRLWLLFVKGRHANGQLKQVSQLNHQMKTHNIVNWKPLICSSLRDLLKCPA